MTAENDTMISCIVMVLDHYGEQLAFVSSDEGNHSLYRLWDHYILYTRKKDMQDCNLHILCESDAKQWLNRQPLAV